MGLMAFEKLRCKVRFGYINPNKIDDPLSPDGRTKTKKNDRNRLVESIKEEGVRNPLVIIAYENKPLSVHVGHHRLWAAKRAKAKEIPVIVNDFCDAFPDFEVLESLDEVRSKFIDQPNLVRSYVSGVSTSEPLRDGETWWKEGL